MRVFSRHREHPRRIEKSRRGGKRGDEEEGEKQALVDVDRWVKETGNRR